MGSGATGAKLCEDDEDKTSITEACQNLANSPISNATLAKAATTEIALRMLPVEVGVLRHNAGD